MIEVLKQALEALETTWYHVGTFAPTDDAIELYDQARTSLRQAIAELESQEPVAIDWERIAKVQNAKLMAMCDEVGGFEKLCEVMNKYKATHPPQRTEQEPVECDGDFPEGFDKSLDIPAQALRQANAALCEVTNNRMWDVPALAERMLMFCRNTHPPQRKPLTHEQRFDLLTAFEPYKNKWEAPAILIDMVEAAHGIKE